MGLTERHWFENEDVPENYEWALEDAVYNSCTNKKTDTVEVVRCKDCKYAHITYDGYCKYCDMFTDDDGYPIERYHSGDWFCADGKRKEGR